MKNIATSHSRMIKSILVMIILFGTNIGGTLEVLANSGHPISDNVNKKNIIVLYDAKDPYIQQLVNNYVDMVRVSYSSIEKRSIDSSKELYSNMMISAWAIVYFFHGDKNGISTPDSHIPWIDVANVVNKSYSSQHLFVTCHSENIVKFADITKVLFTVEGEKDGNVLMIDALFTLSSLMMDSTDEKRVAAEKILLNTLKLIETDIADLIVRYLMPIEPLPTYIAHTIPENSSQPGPVGEWIDDVLDWIWEKVLRPSGAFTLELGKTYVSAVTDTFGKAYGFVKEGVSTIVGTFWEYSVTPVSDDVLIGSISVDFSTQDSGFIGTVIEALIGGSITVEGGADFTLRIITEPVERIEVIDWNFRFRITLSKTLGLYDLLNQIWSSANDLIDKLPKKIRGRVKTQLNRAKLTPYLGAEFELFLNNDGDDEFVQTVFFGVSMYIDTRIVDIGGGAEVELSSHFTSKGNFFTLSLDFGYEVDVPWPFKDLNLGWAKVWKIGPLSPEGHQMNPDTDGDGLTDSFETQIGTNPNNADSDNDGLPDGVELAVYFTFPTDPDSDNDGLTDGAEVSYFEGRYIDPLGDYDGDNKSHVLDPDSDNDGLTDGEEVNGVNSHSYASDPLKRDSDGDGLTDNQEVKGTLSITVNGNTRPVFSDPMNADSDGDLLHDKEEVMLNSDPLLTDTDTDGISDFNELRRYSILWNKTDTDGDGLTDGEEILGKNVPGIGTVTSDPNLNDTDGDGLTDFYEVKTGTLIGSTVFYSHPRFIDTDTDGVSDFEEVKITPTNPYLTKPNVTDTDGDGLADNEIYVHGTDPTNVDSDNDNLIDGDEVNVWSSKPLINDSDADGILDGDEISYFNTQVSGFDENSDYDSDGIKGILDFDSDGGGVSDGAEFEANNATYTFNLTDPSDDKWADSDHDGMPDLWEDNNGLLKNDATDNMTDTDGDGLLNVYEYRNNTNPQIPDTDGDGISDGLEVNYWRSIPTNKDSDGDGLTDGSEVAYFNDTILTKSNFTRDSNFDTDSLTGIMDNDTDGDGLSDGTEASLTGYSLPIVNSTLSDTDTDGLSDGIEVLTYHTDPTTDDTDVDGLKDIEEINGVMIEWNGTGITVPMMVFSDPNIADTDNDGLTDGEEVLIWNSFPRDPDSDNDSINDGHEVNYFLPYGFTQFSNYDGDIITGIQDADSDNDGLLDGEELARGTNPTVVDSDGDQMGDYDEVYGYGFNYTDPFTSLPQQILFYTDPLDSDSDDDGLEDGEEVNGIIPYNWYTDPTDKDTDGDGLIDGVEVGGINMTVMNNNLTVVTNPMHPDTDGDMISDFEEIYSWNWFSKRIYDVRQRTDVVSIGSGDAPPLQVQMTRETQYTSIAALRGGYITNPTIPDTDNDGLTEGQEKYGMANYTFIQFPSHNFEAISMPVITNPVKNDTDGDGLLDGTEVNATNPNRRDTDEDGLSDFDEINIYHTSPTSFDTDNDQLNDKFEVLISYQNSTLLVNKTDPRDYDTDKDGLTDGFEKSILHSHPLNNDTDYDGLLDGDEYNLYKTNPFLNDTDNDGLTDPQEINLYLTDPLDPDSDDDGIYDGVEVNFYLTDPLDPDENNDDELDGWDYDYDNDNLTDYEETIVYGTFYYEEDTDEDGLWDGAERDYFEFWDEDPAGDPDKDGLENLLDPDSDNDGLNDSMEYTYGTNPAKVDTDKDQLDDYDEIFIYFTDPRDPDTDDDGLIDSKELEIGTDPLDADSDNDGWNDGMDPEPLNPLSPNLLLAFIGVPSVALLALGVVYRQRLAQITSNMLEKLRQNFQNGSE